MLGRTTTKPLLKDLNLGATEMQSIGLCRKWTAVAIKEENLPHCSVAHERVARKIITCFMKETVENVVIFEGCLGWRLDVSQGDAAWRGRAGLCVPAGPWDGERKWGRLVFLVLRPSLPHLSEAQGTPVLSLSGHLPGSLVQRCHTSKMSFNTWRVGLPLRALACPAHK